MDVRHNRQQLFANKLTVLRRSSCSADQAPFFPLYLQSLMVGEKPSFTVYVKIKSEKTQEINFLPFLDAEEILEASLITMLAQLGIDRFYFHRQDLEPVLAYLNNHLMLLDSSREDHAREKLLVLAEHLNFSLHRAFNSPHLGRHISLAQIQLDRLVLELEKSPSSLKLVWELLYRDYCLYKHSVNVCLLGVAFMLFLHKSRQESLLMGLACLFHDLGMTRIPEDLLYKVEPLEPEEWETVRKHPHAGYQVLQHTNSMPPEVLQLVLEHHENADGSGYPRGLPTDRQHPLSRVLRLVDAYDGLTCHRPFRQALTPFAALQTLSAQTGSAGRVFDPRSLRNFIRFLALP